MFYGIFYFMAWIFVSLRLIFCGFFIDLIYESFKVAIDVDFAVFGTVGFCSNWGLLLLSKKGFGLNVSKDLYKILLCFKFTGLSVELFFKVLNDLIFSFELVLQVDNFGFHLILISLKLSENLMEFVGEILIDLECMSWLGQLIHDKWSFIINSLINRRYFRILIKWISGKGEFLENGYFLFIYFRNYSQIRYILSILFILSFLLHLVRIHSLKNVKLASFIALK